MKVRIERAFKNYIIYLPVLQNLLHILHTIYYLFYIASGSFAGEKIRMGAIEI